MLLKRFFFLLLLTATSGMVWAQQPGTEDLGSFVPKGYKLRYQYNGDLNQDSLQDKIIVVETDRSLGDDSLRALLPPGTNLLKRPVIILLRQPDHSLKRVTRNDQAIGQVLGNTDPFTTIRCGIGTFTIEQTVQDGSQHCTIASRFEWSAKQSDWYLKLYSHSCIFTTAGAGSDDAGYKEKTPKNFGKITFGKYKYPMEIEIDEWGQ